MSTQQVFISYKREDADAPEAMISAIAAHIRSLGCEPLLDRDIPKGEGWERVLDERLVRCHAAVVVFTRLASTSKHVLHEIRHLVVRWHAGDVVLIPIFVAVDPYPVDEDPLPGQEELRPIQGCKAAPAADVQPILDELTAGLAGIVAELVPDRLGQQAESLSTQLPETPGLLRLCLRALGLVEDGGIDLRLQVARGLLEVLGGRGPEAASDGFMTVLEHLRDALADAKKRRGTIVETVWPHVWIDRSAAAALAPLSGTQAPGGSFALRSQRPLLTVPAHLVRAAQRWDACNGFTLQPVDAHAVVAGITEQLRAFLAEQYWLDDPDADAATVAAQIGQSRGRRITVVDLPEDPPSWGDLQQARDHFPGARIVFTSKTRLESGAPAIDIAFARPELTDELEERAWSLLKDAHLKARLGRPRVPKLGDTGG